MQSNYWQRQTADKPLFPDLIWSRPETKNQAGKLGIIGGNSQSFAAAAEAYQAATSAGIGSARVLLPDSLKKSVGRLFEAGEFAPSTPSGSFAQTALDSVLELAEWADALLIAGDLAHNSETAILLEKLLSDYQGKCTLTKDAVDYFTASPVRLLERHETLVVISFAQLQKIAMHAHFHIPFTFGMDFLHLINGLHEFCQTFQPYVITEHVGSIFVGVNDTLSATKQDKEIDRWRVATAARASVWWLQNPHKPYEAITSSLASVTT